MLCVSTEGAPRRIVITEWALTSYYELLESGVFDKELYRGVLRPDARRLRSLDSDPKFGLSGFWGAASIRAGSSTIPGGFKMKWHNFGPRNVNLRLCVALLHGDAYLCQGYVKNTAFNDRRQLAKFADHICLLRGRPESHVLGELR